MANVASLFRPARTKAPALRLLPPAASAGVERARLPDILPDMIPDRDRRRGGATGAGAAVRRVIFTARSAHDEPTDFRAREESRDPIARLTVYAMNATVMVFAFPVGFGLLIFNILGGENLRTTAHTMALVGLGTTLVSSGAIL